MTEMLAFDIAEKRTAEHEALAANTNRSDAEEIALAVHEVANSIRNMTRWVTFGNASSVDGHGALENVISSLREMSEMLGAAAEAQIVIAKKMTSRPKRRAASAKKVKKTRRART